MDIRISKENPVPLRQQIAAQIEFQIAIGRLKPGDPLPSVRTLARKLGIHHNTVSQAYQDVTALNLLAGKRGTRVLVRIPAQRTTTVRLELDDVINHAIQTARHHGYSLQELSSRVAERLRDEPPDHVLVLSSDAGMQRILKAELESAVKCPVKACSPNDVLANPELALGALVVSSPGGLPIVAEILPKNQPPIPIQYSAAEPQLARLRNLARPSIIAVVSVSAHYLIVARGVLSPITGTKHALLEYLYTGEGNEPIPNADVLVCDMIVAREPIAHRHASKLIAHELISAECLRQALISPPEQKS